MALMYTLFEECIIRVPNSRVLNEHGCPSVHGKELCTCECHLAARQAVEDSIKRTSSPDWSPVRFD